jgi:hypothetical protein
MQLNGFDGLAAHLRKAAHLAPAAIEAELAKQGEPILKEIKAKFGTYQAGWAQLAETTQEKRVKLGFAPNDPLVMSGALREAVAVKAKGDRLFIGIEAGRITLTSPGGKSVDAALVMGVHEFGSTNGRVPARPVFGPVAFHMQQYAVPLAVGVLRRIGL